MPRTPLGALTGLRWSARALAAAMPGRRRRLIWCELGNKLEAYEIFRRASRLPQAAQTARASRATGRGRPLAVLIERAGSLGLNRTLWAIEGLGYGYAESRAGAGADPLEWLAADVAGLPAASLTALHCGIGLSLARRRLAAGARAPAGELRRLLAGYLAVCREHASPDHAPCLIEALGFIARLRLVRRAAEVAAELARLDAEAHACFWHGVGRASYFLPGYAAPRSSAPWRAAEWVERQVPEGEARDNALAGLACAITLVNLRHPRVLEEFLRRRAAQVGAAPAFARGVCSAVLVSHHCAPEDPHLAAWRRYRPEPPGSEVARLWQRQVAGPAAAALADGAHRLRRDGRLGALFPVRPERRAAGAGVAMEV
jgi:hypothetical protein